MSNAPSYSSLVWYILILYFLIFVYIPEKNILEVVGFDDLNTNTDLRVRKMGRTTGRTEGYLKDTIPSVKVKNFKFKNCYHVVNIDDTIFFKEGDSGSGVYLIQDETISKAVGIAFAFMKYSPHTFVCRMDGIIDTLRLNLVMYPNENIANIGYSQNDAVHEPMDCSNWNKLNQFNIS